MKTMRAVVLLSGVGSLAGAQFQNLGFDDANTSSPVPDLLPGWTLTHGGSAATDIRYNDYAASGDYAVLFDSQGVGALFLDFVPEGKYALALGFSQSMQYELTQVGEIPVGVRFLTYTSKGGPFEVRIDDQLLQPLAPGSYFLISDQRTLAFDVGSFSGQNVKLSLRETGLLDPFTLQTYGNGYLDSIAFSVPEPRLSALFAMGGCGLSIALWCNRARST